MQAHIEGEYLSVESGTFKDDSGIERAYRSLKVLQDDQVVRVSLPSEFDLQSLPELRSIVRLSVTISPKYQGRGFKCRLVGLATDLKAVKSA